MSLPVVIDTDPGVDDALALLYALASPELAVEAITVVAGNVRLPLGVRNALLTLEASGAANPPSVYAGRERPLRRDPLDAAHVHGADGLGGASEGREPSLQAQKEHAVDFLLRTLSERPGEITVVALGPLTNFGAALERDPEILRRARGVVVMGGSLSVGNVTPAAEYNFYADPEAAQAVLKSGCELTVVGLDATRQAVLTRERMEQASLAPFARRLLEHYVAFFEKHRGMSACYLHDPLAVAAAADPSLIRTTALQADVEAEGRLTRGMLVADRREGAPPGPVRIAVGTDADRFAELFLGRLAQRARRGPPRTLWNRSSSAHSPSSSSG